MKMKIRSLFLAVLLCILCLSACNPVQLNEEVIVTQGGFAFHQIPEYEVLTSDSGAAMLFPGADAQMGPAIDMSGHEVEEPLEVGELMKGLLDPDAELSEPDEIEVSGHAGMSTIFTYEGEYEWKIKGRLVVIEIVYPELYYYFFMVGWTDEAQWDDSFAKKYDAVLRSVTFLEP
jgi:hypothetical protein